MDDNAALWASLTAPNGKKYKVFRLSMMVRARSGSQNVPRTFINSTFTNGANVYPAYTLKSCRDPNGFACKVDGDCGGGQHCAVGKCTNGVARTGCDEMVACSGGLQCVMDPLKVALDGKAQAQWQQAMPGWKHIGLRADTIALWSGAIHCITRTIPVGQAQKTVPDGFCVQGQCACSDGGANHACKASSECFGPQWQCGCSICAGKCGNGKACNDDADCSLDGVTVPTGACSIDPGQGCYGQSGGTGGTDDACQGVSYEGQCNCSELSYCEGDLKTQSCKQCCGWDKANAYYNCDVGCGGGCVPECDTASQQGCSDKGTHMWTCVASGGCLKRQWTWCAGGCDAATAKCKAVTGNGGGLTQCPDKPDAGSTDTGGAELPPAPDVQVEPDLPPDVPAETALDAGPVCVPACAGKQCGANGCGGVCGTCPPGSACSFGLCLALPVDGSGAETKDASTTDTPQPADLAKEVAIDAVAGDASSDATVDVSAQADTQDTAAPQPHTANDAAVPATDATTTTGRNANPNLDAASEGVAGNRATPAPAAVGGAPVMSSALGCSTAATGSGIGWAWALLPLVVCVRRRRNR
jgi:uncharacterized protein (TIGR03382 family)